MKAYIQIDQNNSAFDDENYHVETARILRDLADRLERKSPTDISDEKLRDINGNRVGEMVFRG